jgi:hypothetical protein
LVSVPNSSVSQENKEPCILSHVCDKVSRNLLILLMMFDFLEASILSLWAGYFSFLAIQASNSARFKGFCK